MSDEPKATEGAIDITANGAVRMSLPSITLTDPFAIAYLIKSCAAGGKSVEEAIEQALLTADCHDSGCAP